MPKRKVTDYSELKFHSVYFKIGEDLIVAVTDDWGATRHSSEIDAFDNKKANIRCKFTTKLFPSTKTYEDKPPVSLKPFLTKGRRIKLQIEITGVLNLSTNEIKTEGSVEVLEIHGPKVFKDSLALKELLDAAEVLGYTLNTTVVVR